MKHYSDELARVIVEAWEAIDQEYIDKLIGVCRSGRRPYGMQKGGTLSTRSRVLIGKLIRLHL